MRGERIAKRLGKSFPESTAEPGGRPEDVTSYPKTG